MGNDTYLSEWGWSDLHEKKRRERDLLRRGRAEVIPLLHTSQVIARNEPRWTRLIGGPIFI